MNESPLPFTVADALKLQIPEASRRTLKQLASGGRIEVEGKPVKRLDQEVARDARVVILPRHVPTLPWGIRILYEDDRLIAVAKPPDLLTIATDSEKARTVWHVLFQREARKGGRIYVVHRLDRGASGVLLFAKDERTKLALQKKWHRYEKTYAAVVQGAPEREEGVWESYLVEDANHKMHGVPESARPEDAQLARTEYRLLQRHKELSMLWIRLDTGRKNQIRVHCAEAGHPILGDDKYGEKKAKGKGGDGGSSDRPPRAHNGRAKKNRLYLHAWTLLVEHPSTGEWMQWEDPLPLPFRKKIPGIMPLPPEA